MGTPVRPGNRAPLAPQVDRVAKKGDSRKIWGDGTLFQGRSLLLHHQAGPLPPTWSVFPRGSCPNLVVRRTSDGKCVTHAMPGLVGLLVAIPVSYVLSGLWVREEEVAATWHNVTWAQLRGASGKGTPWEGKASPSAISTGHIPPQASVT